MSERIERKYTRQELTWFFICMVLISFLLHAVWEMAQMPAYKEMVERPLLQTAVRCTPATLGDVVITFWIFAIGALAARNLGWAMRPRWNVYLVASLLGATHAVWIERAAIASGRWSYTKAMPIIPRLEIGVWPFLQLMLLTPLTFWISCFFVLRSSKRATQSESNSQVS